MRLVIANTKCGDMIVGDPSYPACCLGAALLFDLPFSHVCSRSVPDPCNIWIRRCCRPVQAVCSLVSSPKSLVLDVGNAIDCEIRHAALCREHHCLIFTSVTSIACSEMPLHCRHIIITSFFAFSLISQCSVVPLIRCVADAK